jgi:hypothetical protein
MSGSPIFTNKKFTNNKINSYIKKSLIKFHSAFGNPFVILYSFEARDIYFLKSLLKKAA